ncbi:hypothetical protein [Halorarum salinum]|uniref:Uncharacterized protein n=1 Tax=Halorarum salinum TaxID=2743089 RepID=A0A7D5LAF2_9EURY|nr:hypothetical protein [Halobaculum salinum]QLG62013.1 hypothetical protein HUG12_09870 [Halobaculum salinum]
MPTFEVDTTKIPAFKVEDTYLFKHYFDEEDVFTLLQEYYLQDKYRFEIPASDYTKVQQQLENYFYELQREDDLTPYCVVVEKGTDYADILRNAVLTKERSGHLIFLLKDNLSVEQAVEHGAIRLAESTLNEDI